MLKSLHIQHLILIDRMRLAFHPKFNALTGETGSGKTAILEAIRLIGGGRTDSSAIRRGEEKARVEAVFETTTSIVDLLDKKGIEVEDDLIIVREIGVGGKSRAWINDRQVQIASLKELAPLLFNLLGQHETQMLAHLQAHRDLLDRYGGHAESIREFSVCFAKEATLRQRIVSLKQSEANRLRRIDTLQRELSEIADVDLKEGEEEELFDEYSRLCHVKELAEKQSALRDLLTDGALAALNKAGPLLSRIEELDKNISNEKKRLTSLILEIHDLCSAVTSQDYSLNPIRLAEIEERLSTINALKRKYGPEIALIHAYEQQGKEEMSLALHADIEIEDLEGEIEVIIEESKRLAKTLTKKRKEAAKGLQEILTEQIRSLNMQGALVEITVEKKERSSTGEDHIEWRFTPNVGEGMISIKDCASGGELSRILLAAQTALSAKSNAQTLIFDEVDAGIGGQTAAIVGEKMQAIARNKQVLAITHFPQVARYADYHIQISKEHTSERTFTTAAPLMELERQKELARMSGEI